MELSIIYYLFLLFLFGYFVVYHFPRMNSISLSSSETASVDNPIDQEEDRDYDTHYHHPVWPQRWYYPEFTKEAAAIWCEEPCMVQRHR
jgi:hypothetical protein